MTETGQFPKPFPAQLQNAVRSAVIAYAILGLIVGIVALFWPTATLLVVAVLFGIALIIGGVFRLVTAFSAQDLPTGWRILLGIAGAIVLIAGVICLFHPGQSLTLLAILIGIGWIFQGVQDLLTYSAGSEHTNRGWIIASAILSILAGVIVCTLPGLAVGTFVWVGGILLIVVSIATLLTLPKKA